MAASPKYEVYSAADEYLAAFKYASDALMFVDAIGEPKTTIRLGHSKRLVLWTRGAEGNVIENSHARAIDLVMQREDEATR